jgi:hypothetical protein
MTRALWGSAVAALLVFAGAGCGGDNNNFPLPTPGDDSGLPPRTVLDGGTTTGDGPRNGEGGSSSPDVVTVKVTVEIKSPTKDAVARAAERFTPSVNVLIDSAGASQGDTVSEVTATVTKMGAKMSAASAKLNETKNDQAPGSTVAVHQFTDTPVDISKLEGGNYELKVAVKTVGNLTADATVTFMVDSGPIIRIDRPVENQYYRESATVDVTVTDPLFGVEAVSMWLGQTQLMVSGPMGPTMSQYSGTIQFNSYNPPLEGDQLLTVRATNKLKTEAVVRRKFVADNKGPTITATVPKTGDLIGRVITVSAQVTDPAGVLDSSVVAVIAHGDMMFEVKLLPAAAGSTSPAGTYSALFDTARLPANALFPSISFRASDNPGNQSSVGYLVSLDNTPPLADLDPPNDLRLVKKDGDFDRCSWPFDPLGWDSVNDGATVNQLFDIRARVEDQGNDPLAGHADFTPIAGLDDTRVQLLVLDDVSRPLVVDTNGDGLCDAINPTLTPTTMPMSASDALLINLTPIAPGGSADFTPSAPPANAPCVSGAAPKAPDPMCDTSNLTVTLAYAATQAAIWTVPPVIGDKLQCLGRQFDGLGNHVQDGWVCAAVAAADKLGNMQVSRPLRVCLDKDGQGGECGAVRGPMPDCTGTQTASKPNIVIDSTKPCRPWRSYSPGEYRRTQ